MRERQKRRREIASGLMLGVACALMTPVAWENGARVLLAFTGAACVMNLAFSAVAAIRLKRMPRHEQSSGPDEVIEEDFP
ncbi:hypothetical protein GCM10023405_48060 [Streptomonospora salina]